MENDLIFIISDILRPWEKTSVSHGNSGSNLMKIKDCIKKMHFFLDTAKLPMIPKTILAIPCNRFGIVKRAPSRPSLLQLQKNIKAERSPCNPAGNLLSSYRKPGVLERYTHLPVLRKLLHHINWRVRGEMKTYSTLEAAKKIGVSKSTLFAWFKYGKVKDVARDHRGWRIFTNEDIHRLREFRRNRRAMPPIAAGIERRHFTRARAAIPIVYALRESPKRPGKEKIETVTVNVSGGGFLMERNEPLQTDGFLDIKFNLPPPAKKVKAIGQIRWVREVRKDQESSFLLGCWFRSINPHQRKQVIDYIFGSKPTT